MKIHKSSFAEVIGYEEGNSIIRRCNLLSMRKFGKADRRLRSEGVKRRVESTKPTNIDEDRGKTCHGFSN